MADQRQVDAVLLYTEYAGSQRRIDNVLVYVEHQGIQRRVNNVMMYVEYVINAFPANLVRTHGPAVQNF